MTLDDSKAYRLLNLSELVPSDTDPTRVWVPEPNTLSATELVSITQERNLLRATLEELRQALPKCVISGCERTQRNTDCAGTCDEHTITHTSAWWAAVARRLSW